MDETPYSQDDQWKESLERLSVIRETGDYSNYNVDFIRMNINSFDDRVRGGAVLAAQGCIFEPQILDAIQLIAEEDVNEAIRKAAIQALGAVLEEGVQQGMVDNIGADTQLDDVEEWDEYQSGNFREDFQRVQSLLLLTLEEEDAPGIQQATITSLSWLGMLTEIREHIERFFSSDRAADRLVALHAMGKFPQYWEDEIASMIHPGAPVSFMKEAISSSFSSDSLRLAEQIRSIIDHTDPEVVRYALLTLANINKTEGLGELFQQYILHENFIIQEAARDAIETFTQKNFRTYIDDEEG